MLPILSSVVGQQERKKKNMHSFTADIEELLDKTAALPEPHVPGHLGHGSIGEPQQPTGPGYPHAVKILMAAWRILGRSWPLSSGRMHI